MHRIEGLAGLNADQTTMAQRPVSLVRLQYLLNMDLYLKESFSCIAISFEKAFAYEAASH
jgi:hypothetical protein